MSVTAIAASALVLLAIIGGLTWALVRSSRKNGVKDGEIHLLEARIAFLSQALSSRGVADPDLDDLLLPEEPDGPAA